MGRIIIFLTILIALASQIVVNDTNAQSSSTWRTRVGNPIVSADGLLGTGLTIKAAYDKCASGDTHEPPASLTCLRTELGRLGMEQSQIDAFSANYNSRKVGSPSGRSAPCIQCLGFVGLVLSTHTGNDSLQQGSAKEVAGLQSFTAGSTVFQRLSQGTPPQPGDVAAHGGGTWGHIAIVKEVVGNVSFIALESNGDGVRCWITDDRQLLTDQYGYVFFRAQ